MADKVPVELTFTLSVVAWIEVDPELPRMGNLRRLQCRILLDTFDVDLSSDVGIFMAASIQRALHNGQRLCTDCYEGILQQKFIGT
jgi:hypothetical protein